MGGKPSKSLINKGVSAISNQKTPTAKYLNSNLLSDTWFADGNNANVLASIRFVQHDFQCFSDWTNAEMKVFWSFIHKLHTYTWVLLYGTGGKSGNKTGLGYTATSLKDYPESEFITQLDPEISLFELRVDDKKRVHGFRSKAIFYICWLDKDHEIFPSGK